MRAEKLEAQLTPAEQAAVDAELAEVRKRAKRRLRVLLWVLAAALYVWAAMVISAQNK